MNNFEKSLLQFFDKKTLSKIQKQNVAIAGAGGIGSNVAFNLVRSGFKNFVIADFDFVEFSNLNRQFYFENQVNLSKAEALCDNLIKINSNLNIKLSTNKLDERNIKSIFKNCDIIVEGFDLAEDKIMLLNTFLDDDKFLVLASGITGYGISDDILLKKIKENIYIVGDMKIGIDSFNLPYCPKLSVIAGKMADLILNHTISL